MPRNLLKFTSVLNTNHILNNPVYEYCLAYDINIYYITYDFETMEQVKKKAGKSATNNSHLILISVSSCVKSASGFSTKNFSLHDSQNFIQQQLEWLFEESLTVCKDKQQNSCVPESIDSSINVITVFRFNSSRFDSNLFKKNLNISHW